MPRNTTLSSLCIILVLLIAPTVAAQSKGAQLREFGPLLHHDDFRSGLDQWRLELERGGRVVANDGMLEIDVPAGATLWFRHEVQGPIAIVYDATAIAAGGPNDRVSDLNCFWMASNRDDGAPVFEPARSGRFAEYDTLRTYYVGLGGNGNTTTRFRRYAGTPGVRPLLPQHDLASPDVLLVPNRKQRITLIANGQDIEYWRDDRRLVQFVDAEPYRRGWFALRTTQSHLAIQNFRVYRLRQ